MKIKVKDKLLKPILMFEGVMGNWQGVGNLPQGSGEHPIATVLHNVLNWLLMIFGLLAVISFIIAGLLYLTAGGDEGMIKKAKSAVTYGIIGTVIGLIGLIVIRTIDALLRGA